jgi:hypothetical protein
MNLFFLTSILIAVIAVILIGIGLAIINSHPPMIRTLPLPNQTLPVPIPIIRELSKSPSYYACAHNETLDEGILCLPKDSPLIRGHHGGNQGAAPVDELN